MDMTKYLQEHVYVFDEAFDETSSNDEVSTYIHTHMPTLPRTPEWGIQRRGKGAMLHHYLLARSIKNRRQNMRGDVRFRVGCVRTESWETAGNTHTLSAALNMSFHIAVTHILLARSSPLHHTMLSMSTHIPLFCVVARV